ncbi:type III pantothenate kinase [Intestinimonas massiliensis (ex Afouda et al. 2020)]|uniref:type III pantothenate kinase n=1 Tax=Intestinimonas massiliensis (ex Afouda et al. 2020) TaxID=1673721 RepID=UPI00103274FB|nr:type III pantothenate kinase [Intestinimonas massiliensis (ex Afouda et al. 2020)]
MLLTVDIGNTTVAVAGFAGERLAFLRRLPSDRDLDGPGWQTALGELLAGAGSVRGSALASVVPDLTGRVADALSALTGKPVLTVDKNTPTGLPLGHYDAKNLGMDRVVDCVAALSRYAPPLAVFDMGTATTLSVVGADGMFQGGMILPGLSLSVNALSARAAQLPPITLSPPEGLIGTNTETCMRYGALYGAAGAIEGIVARLEEQLGPLTVILTGGNSAYVRPLLRVPTAWEPNLTFLGLRQLWLKQYS